MITKMVNTNKKDQTQLKEELGCDLSKTGNMEVKRGTVQMGLTG